MPPHAQSRQRFDNAQTVSVWRLQSTPGKLLECRIWDTPSAGFSLSVVIGSDNLLRESYPDATSAMRRAMQIQENLLKSGGWVDTVIDALP